MVSTLVRGICHACSVSKGVILQNVIPYTLAMRRHRERADSASGTRRSKVTEVESSITEKEATGLKDKDFVVALYLTGMHGNKAEGRARLPNHPFAIEDSAGVGCACTRAEANLDNDASVIYDAWSLEIRRNDITRGVIKRTPGMP